MAWQQMLGGLMQGVGSGLVLQAQHDGLRLREERMAELQAKRDEEQRAFTAEQGQLGRDFSAEQGAATRAHQTELSERSDARAAANAAASDSRATGLLKLRDQLDDENAAEERRIAGEAATVSRAQQLEDDAARRAHEKELAALRESEKNMPPEKAWDLAQRVNSKLTYGGDIDEATTDWGGMAETLEGLGQPGLADKARARISNEEPGIDPAVPVSEAPATPGKILADAQAGESSLGYKSGEKVRGLISSAGDYFLGREGEKPTTPGTAMAGTDPQRDEPVAKTALPIPRLPDGSVNEKLLREGMVYSLPGGATYRWTGSSFNPMTTAP
jgi:hypothetical protein